MQYKTHKLTVGIWNTPLPTQQ